jgi:hypothetical protein
MTKRNEYGSGVTGVSRSGRRWTGSVTLHLGTFETVDDAAAAVHAKRAELGLAPNGTRAGNAVVA